VEIANSDEVDDKESEGSTAKIGGDATSTPVSNGIFFGFYIHTFLSREIFYKVVNTI